MSLSDDVLRVVLSYTDPVEGGMVAYGVIVRLIGGRHEWDVVPVDQRITNVPLEYSDVQGGFMLMRTLSDLRRNVRFICKRKDGTDLQLVLFLDMLCANKRFIAYRADLSDGIFLQAPGFTTQPIPWLDDFMCLD